MNIYDKSLKYEIFVNEEYKYILPYLKDVEVVFDIWAYKWYFSEYILSKWFKGRLVLVEAVSEFLNKAKENLYVFSNDIIYLNCILGKWNRNFYVNLDKPWQSWFYFLNDLDFVKDLKFFKTNNYKLLKFVTKCCFDDIVLRYWWDKMWLKMDIEWEEINVLQYTKVINKFKFLIIEYHLFNKLMLKKFNNILLKLKQYFVLKNIKSKYTSKIWLLVWENK